MKRKRVEVELLGAYVGYVTLVDVQGNDSFIASSARMSTGGESKGEEADTKLLKHLIRSRHTSPFEMTNMVFDIEAPLFVANQFVRHRMGEFNFKSGRYSEFATNNWYFPVVWRSQDKRNKQMSSAPLGQEINEEAVNAALELFEKADEAYAKLIKLGVAREMARVVLPMSTFTTFRWGQNIHSLMHMLGLRLAEDAQPETRVIAEQMEKCFAWAFPITHGLWREKWIRP
jgi:thymidylate synthase (FAD)